MEKNIPKAEATFQDVFSHAKELHEIIINLKENIFVLESVLKGETSLEEPRINAENPNKEREDIPILSIPEQFSSILVRIKENGVESLNCFERIKSYF